MMRSPPLLGVGEDADDPDMSLLSTAALGSSPLHAGDGDGSSSEETLHFPALRRLMRLSFRSCFTISFSLCYALHAARRVSAASWLCLKITFSGRGAFVGMRWVHFN
jgi:hypothetical protein